MNTGLHDVWNLAWKLDLVVRGRGGDALLDSYGAERLPVIESVIGMTDALTKVMGTPSRFVQTLRDAVIPMVSRLAPFQRAFVERLSELGVAYRGSPIVEGAGARYFDDTLRGGAGIRDRFLLLYDGADAAVGDAARRLADSMRELIEPRPRSGGGDDGITLLRPDGYVAYSAPSGDVDASLGAVRALVARQTGGGLALGAGVAIG